jgi:hypothetical protein
MSRAAFRFAYQWVSQFVDPFRFARAVRNSPAFVADYLAYRRLPGSETIALRDLQPSLHERSGSHEFDPHYFFLNAWAMRRVCARHPALHFDVASQTAFITALSAVLPVCYIDYRPLPVHLSGLHNVAANAVHLPLRDGSLPSVSCLHVAEHIGLGRYGDPLDPQGTIKAAAELTRVLMPGGELLFALPIGRPRVCFNAHRIHSAAAIREAFASLELLEYSGVGDDGVFAESIPLDRFEQHEYACGMFRFRKVPIQ